MLGGYIAMPLSNTPGRFLIFALISLSLTMSWQTVAYTYHIYKDAQYHEIQNSKSSRFCALLIFQNQIKLTLEVTVEAFV